jgi:glycosyltransferase involved in cell wall biosynthesis
MQRTYRHLWKISARRAYRLLAISPKTAEETYELVERSPRVVLSGRDHVSIETGNTNRSGIVTYAHHTNKRPELAFEAYRMLGEELQSEHALTILGARPAHAKSLLERAAEFNLSSRVSIPGYVTDERYRATISGAAVILLTSRDEGFGIPMVEAEQVGAWGVLTADSGVGALHPNAIVIEPIAKAIAAALRYALSNPRGSADVPLRTWSDLVAEIRDEAQTLIPQ